MDTPRRDDIEDDQEEWDDDNLLPADYWHGYDEALTTNPDDTVEDVDKDQAAEVPPVGIDDISEEPTIEVMPTKFTPDEGTEAG